MARGLIILLLSVVILAMLTSETLSSSSIEVASPYDRIREDQIQIFRDKIVIHVDGASWAKYADTNSMDPLLDYGANGIELIPKNENDLFIGDVAAYESGLIDGLIVHRIVDIGYDDKGKYFIFKGDNTNEVDPGRVRFSQIKYVLIGVLY